MKTFRYTAPESGTVTLSNRTRIAGTYFNAFISFLILVPYLSLCLASISAFGGIYVLGMLWLFVVSPVLIVLQLAFCVKAVKLGTIGWKSHARSLALVAISYLLLAIGLFGNDCAVSA
ncbi:hypothetical protein ACFOEW_16100 [Alteromonas oceani]|uniref:Uncharacterized protein n=1 Tax=Alteromonas oceani TaxID=2071609 RepID=A0ABV7JZ21_9ALTE|nr:hypothetical protein [Alteromonas oceani]